MHETACFLAHSKGDAKSELHLPPHIIASNQHLVQFRKRSFRKLIWKHAKASVFDS